MTLPNLTSLIASVFFGLSAIYFSIKEEKIKKTLTEQNEKIRQKIYQIEILKEIQGRIGYELNLEKVIDVITGSLRNLFHYSTASSIVVKEDKLVFKSYIAEAVDKTFLAQVKQSMLASLTTLLENLPKAIEETFSGVPIKSSPLPVASFFHIPLIVANKVAGLINVSSTKPNLYKEDEMTILYQITNEASNAITKLQEVLTSEEKKREDLTNMMVHELRAPLTAIKDSSDLLLSEEKALREEEAKTMLEIIHREAKVLLDQIGEILDAAKLEAGKLSIQKVKNENIAAVIKKTLLAFSSQAAKKRIVLSLEGNFELPLFSFDPIRIGQVINNLLSNSLKFTPSGGKIVFKTELVGDVNGRYIKISISDTGVGIPREKQKYLFTKYSQASEMKGSTGLGLYVVKGIVEAHKGFVSVQSEQGQGTTISFSLPLDDTGIVAEQSTTSNVLPHLLPN